MAPAITRWCRCPTRGMAAAEGPHRQTAVIRLVGGSLHACNTLCKETLRRRWLFLGERGISGKLYEFKRGYFAATASS